MQVFTDIQVPVEYYMEMIKRQAIVNEGIRFIFRNETTAGFETTEFCYMKKGLSTMRRSLPVKMRDGRTVLADGAQGARPCGQARV